jgi:hypothetical protein
MSDSLPVFSRQRQIGEAGVNAVASLVNDNFKWIFRRVGGETDYGIDGYIDVVTDTGGVTGQAIAVQIKTGASFFRVKSPNGFVFYGEAKHFNYYVNLAVPVLIILYDEKIGKLYWQQFDPKRTEPTSKGWKIEIPKYSNLLTAKSDLLEIVGPVSELSEEIKVHWALNDALTTEVVPFSGTEWRLG